MEVENSELHSKKAKLPIWKAKHGRHYFGINQTSKTKLNPNYKDREEVVLYCMNHRIPETRRGAEPRIKNTVRPTGRGRIYASGCESYTLVKAKLQLFALADDNHKGQKKWLTKSYRQLRRRKPQENRCFVFSGSNSILKVTKLTKIWCNVHCTTQNRSMLRCALESDMITNWQSSC